MNAFLEIKELEIKRGKFSISVPLLGISKGEIHILTGPSGSGKSTILQAIGGFIESVSGEIFVDTSEISKLPPELRQVGYVFQQSALFPNMTVLDNVAFSLRVRGIEKGERRRRALEWLDRVSLKVHAHKRVDEISGGEAQRVQLARALIADFPVLLLDEPFSALDVALKQDLRVLVRKLVRETEVACLLVSHDPEDVSQLADTFSVIENGEITKIEKVQRL